MPLPLIKIKCRVCQKKTDHANLNANNEMKLGENMALVCCSQCGVMGIEQIKVIGESYPQPTQTCG
jgi:hypothetical protein